MPRDTLTQPTPDGPMGIYLSSPEPTAAHRSPGIIVLQEAFGVNEHVRGVCRRFSEAGFVAAAPELFHRSGAGLELGYTEWEKIKPMMAGVTNAGLTSDLKAAYAFLGDHPLVDPSKILVFGECMGGFASVLASIQLPVNGAIAFYAGGLVRSRPGIGFGPLIDSLAGVRCPLLLVFGGKDAGIPPEDVAEVGKRLQALRKPHQILVMPEGGHGFCCEARPAYHKESAETAWARALAWIREQIGAQASGVRRLPFWESGKKTGLLAPRRRRTVHGSRHE